MALLMSVRPINLLLFAYAQYLIKYLVFEPQGAITALGDFHFALLVIATVCIAAGGYVINDLFDVQIDAINRPERLRISTKISEKKASYFYVFLTTVGVALGFYLAYTIQRPQFAAIFVAVAALLYLYASYLKSVLLVGNLLISLLVGFSLLIVVIFDLLPTTHSFNQELHLLLFKTILGYAGFAVWLNLIREIVKDVQDIDGDKNGGRNTLPIALGRSRTTTIVLALTVLLTMAVLRHMYYNLYVHQWAVLYFLFLLVAPLLYFCIKCYSAKRKADFARLSTLAKILFFTGLSSLWLYPIIGVS